MDTVNFSDSRVVFAGYSTDGPSIGASQIDIDCHGVIGNKIYGLWDKNPLNTVKDVDLVNMQYKLGKRLIFQHQVCIIDTALINELKNYNIDYTYGAGREQLILDGIQLNRLSVGTQIHAGACILEVVSLKTFCQDFFKFLPVPNCKQLDRIMHKIIYSNNIPNYGIFAKVIQPGTVHLNSPVKFDMIDNKKQLSKSISEILESRYKWMSIAEFEKVYPAETCNVAKAAIYNDNTVFK